MTNSDLCSTLIRVVLGRQGIGAEAAVARVVDFRTVLET
jgi:hypothetical protein